jgi:hypothetical protein
MIKLQMHQTSLEGKPLRGTGEIISGDNANEIIEIMKLKSPFTADMSNQEYMDNILSKIKPNKDLRDIDATEFLSQLAENGFISFLPTAGAPPVASAASSSAIASEADNEREVK